MGGNRWFWCIVFASMVFLLLFCGGCGKKAVSRTEEGVISCNSFSKGEAGIVYETAFDTGERKLMFYDIKTESFYPLCSHPNCRHEFVEDCAAVKEVTTFGYLIYGDKLYYFQYKDSGYCLCVSDVSGEGEKVLYEMEKNQSVGSFSAAIDGKLYVVGERYDFEEDYQTDSDVQIGGHVELLEIDLESGKAKKLLHCELGTNGRAVWEIRHIYKGKLYFTSSTRTVKGGDILEDGIYALDTDTGKTEASLILEKVSMAGWREGKAVYYQRAISDEEATMFYELDLETGESEELVKQQQMQLSLLLDGKLIWYEARREGDGSIRNGKWKSCDLATKEVKSFREVTPDEPFLYFEDVFVQDGKEMIWASTWLEREGEEYFSYAVISAEDFLNGSTDYRILWE